VSADTGPSPRPPFSWREWIRALRPRQWTKNLLIFMAPAAGGVLGHWHSTLKVGATFLIFCAVASGNYLINDVMDASSDRLHPVKARRPIALGSVKPSHAAAVGAVLIAAGTALSGIVGSWPLTLVFASYTVVTAAYSLRLKREPVIELALVASGFVLRAIAGGVAAHVPLSEWFLAFTSFAALFVVVGKRSAEHARLGEDRGLHRNVLDQYTETFLRSTLTIAATVTVAAYFLWAFDRTGLLAQSSHHHVVWIELTTVPLVLAILHIFRLLDAGHGGEPERLALQDHTLQAYGLAWLALMAIGLYA